MIVRGGQVVTADGVVEADVAIEDGVVVGVGPELGGEPGLDATGLVVLPGAVDAHVHLNDPGRAHWEGFATGTRALAAGGTTTAVDMPLNALPPTLDGAAFDAKAAAAEGRLHVDVALWGGLVPGNLGALEELAERGVVGFKAFMSSSGVPEFGAADEDTLGEGMRRAAALGLPVAVHAEDDALTARLGAEARAAGGTSLRDWAGSRPVEAELLAIRTALGLAKETGAQLHVVHVSSGAGVRLIAEARARGARVTCETCPHYLVLDEDDALAIGALAKCAPPLRPRAVLEDLWQEVLAGAVDTVGTDHSPSPAGLKEGDDAFAWWGGIGGAQTLLALLLTEGVAARGLPLEELARLTATAPAARVGLPKGTVAVGASADLALVRPGAPWTLEREQLLDRHRLSPFVGRALRGRVVRTLLRGETVALDGAVVGPPRGRLLRRG